MHVCTSSEYQNKYQNYIKKEELRKKATSEEFELSEPEIREQLEQINLEVSRVDALKTLTFGLLEVLDNIIDERNNDDSLSQSDFQKNILKLISTFHHTALKMNDTAFLEQIWSQYNVHAKNNKNNTHVFIHKSHGAKENVASEIVDDVLQEVSNSADRLEENMRRHNIGGGSNFRGSLETVLKLEEDDEQADWGNEDEPRRRGHVKAITILDVDNNEYVLTRPSDLTMFYEGKNETEKNTLISILILFLTKKSFFFYV